MILTSLTKIESLRQMRFAVELLVTVNSAVCAAQTKIRDCCRSPVVDLAAAVQSEQRNASAVFRTEFAATSAALDQRGAECLHAAVWA